MAQYIDKDSVVAKIRGILNSAEAYLKYHHDDKNRLVYSYKHQILTMCELLSFLDTLEVKEVDLNYRKTDWSPSKKQMESLKDMLKYNIGVFDYQKFMEVNSLYDDLTKIVDYETNRQK